MKILIWGEVKSGGPYDIFRRLDYDNIYNELEENYHANSMNVGNKVWIQGIISALSTPENELFFLNPQESWDEINSKYDKIVYSAANMLSKDYLDLIENVSELFKQSKVPVYVIAIGAQTNSYNEIEQLVKDTSKAVSRFMDVIYTTGGEIACRGYFTKEYLDKVAKNTAVVTGCPSLFQNGKNLKIVKQDTNMIPIFNGNAPFDKLSNIYKDAIYIDQGEYLNLAYSLKKNNLRKYLANSISKFGHKNFALYLEGKIKIFYDMPEWRKYIQSSNMNFSMGSRIHGNIMSLLSGIPSVLLPIDSRTREMAEFYNIPTITSSDEYFSAEKVFDKVDYSRFNDNFPKIFDAYNEFLKKCGLVNEINQKNIFWNRKLPQNMESIDKKRLSLKNKMDNTSFLDKIYFSLTQICPQIAQMDETSQNVIVEEYKK